MILNRKNNLGFTLIEMLIAIAIFAFVAAISYSTLNNTLINREGFELNNERFEELGLAIQIIDKDFKQVINAPIPNPFGSSLTIPALSAGGDTDTLIEFSRAGWPNPLSQTRGEIQRVAYRIEDNTLIREYWSVLNRDSSAKAREIKLLSNIDEVKFLFLDDKGSTSNTWPQDSTASTDLPSGIEIELKTQRWGDIRRVYVVAQ